MSQPTILVVDDEKHIRMLYREELEADGYTVATSDGEEDILDVISRETPTIVILDIKLGVNRSGLDLLQEIRAEDQQIPVILSTHTILPARPQIHCSRLLRRQIRGPHGAQGQGQNGIEQGRRIGNY